MLTDNDDGTYTAVFPRLPEEKIVVKQPTEQELMLYAGGTEYGIWPAVLEKACGLHCKESFALLRQLRNISGDIPAENIQYNFDQSVLSKLDAITPLKVGDAERIHRKLVSCFRKHNPIIVARFSIFGRRWKGGIINRHAFAVVDYQPLMRKVGIYNPWGKNCQLNFTTPQNPMEDPRDKGVLEMELSSLLRRFDWMFIYETLK